MLPLLSFTFAGVMLEWCYWKIQSEEFGVIISASRRTDIPAYYSGWFFNRLKEGYVLVRNPMNPHQVGRISLLPDVVDGIVFWTKNPSPMLNRLEELKEYTYYFQFTLNAYGIDAEPNLPAKNNVIIPAFQRLAQEIGKDKVVWRYDPIFFNEKYSMAYHLKYFRVLASKLADYTEKCTVSFLDFYKKTERNISPLGIVKPSMEEKEELMEQFAAIAKSEGLYIDTCAEEMDLKKFGIRPARCIDQGRLERLSGYNLKITKDPNQRRECGCIASIDIGAYDTCANHCLYCYANYSAKTVARNAAAHHETGPLLFGNLSEDDVVKVREAKSCKEYATGRLWPD